MWLFTTYGMFSAVCGRCTEDGTPCRGGPYIDRSTIVVRARVAEHLRQLVAAFPQHLAGVEVTLSNATDYKARIIVPATTWQAVVGAIVAEMAYDNFKSEILRREGASPYEQALHRVWSVGYGLQREAHGPGIYDQPGPGLRGRGMGGPGGTEAPCDADDPAGCDDWRSGSDLGGIAVLDDQEEPLPNFDDPVDPVDPEEVRHGKRGNHRKPARK
jgi:hypothetical protein